MSEDRDSLLLRGQRRYGRGMRGAARYVPTGLQGIVTCVSVSVCVGYGFPRLLLLPLVSGEVVVDVLPHFRQRLRVLGLECGVVWAEGVHLNLCTYRLNRERRCHGCVH